MRLPALNEKRLWKGQLQKNHYPSLLQPPMILPGINHHIGGTYPIKDRIHEEITKGWEEISRDYWKGAKKRMAEYRRKQSTITEIYV
jgi:hypothetical protein